MPKEGDFQKILGRLHALSVSAISNRKRANMRIENAYIFRLAFYASSLPFSRPSSLLRFDL